MTFAGQQALKEWLHEPIEKFSYEKNEVLLRLFLSDDGDTTTMIQQIEKYRSVQYERLETYKLLEHSWHMGTMTTQKKRALMTISFGKKIARTIIEWCDEAIIQLR